jgi:sorbitol/mannitol transport system substrate-binding protein
MKSGVTLLALAVMAVTTASCSKSVNKSTTLTIATVNNSDMLRMKELGSLFELQHPGIRLKWLILEENLLRQRVTTDVAIRAGQFDVVTIGAYEVPIWARQHWLTPLSDLGSAYAADDLLPAIRSAVTVAGVQYAAPFNGEGTVTIYRTDLFQRAGLQMPAHPSWQFLSTAAARLNQPSQGLYGICLRGKAGWGENMALILTMAHSYGARLFDEHWRPQFDSLQWQRTLSTYVELLRDYGPPESMTVGFNESLALYASGKCAIWVDSTVAAPFVSNPRTSSVADRTAFAAAPAEGLGRGANWLWTWALAIPASSFHAQAAKQFIRWAAGPAYLQEVAHRYGWIAVPPGTRQSLYANPQYQQIAPFAAITLEAINAANPLHPSPQAVPYVGVQYAAIPEFQEIGTEVGEEFAAAVAGVVSPEDALAEAQAATRRRMTAAGYPE